MTRNSFAMLNRILLAAIALLFVFAIVRMFLLHTEPEPWLSAAEVIAVIIMMINGTFMKTKYYPVAVGAISLFGLGAIMKILHLPIADQIIIAAFLLLIGTYIVHFFTKKSRVVLDSIKLIFVVAFIVSRLVPYLLRLFHLHWVVLEDNPALYLAVESTLWLAFGYFVFDGLKRKTLLGN